LYLSKPSPLRLTTRKNCDETSVRPQPGAAQTTTTNMATPLRWNMILPNGEPLKWNTPGARFDGTVEEVMAALAQLNNQKPMTEHNLVSAALTSQAVTNITTAVATIRTNLPFLVNLSDEQRKKLHNVTEASQGIARASINFVAQHPEAIPSYYPLTEFNKDATLLDPYQQVASLIETLNTDTQQTLRALYSDLLYETYDIYAFAKTGNRTGAYDDFINVIKGRFSTGPHKKTNPTPPNP
jgi:hypothetical protein